MKTINKLLALIILLASILLKTSIVFSQICNNTVGSLVGPLRVEVQAPAGTPNSFICLTTGSSVCSPTSVPGALTMPGFGVNQNNPAYMLDILCDPTITPATNMDVNISSIGGSGFTANAVGYRIGDSMMLWHNGIQSSVFVGSFAGGGPLVKPGGIENTFVGNLSGRHNTDPTNSATGVSNTYLGFAAGYGDILDPMITPGDSNVCVGVYSGYHLFGGGYNVFIGNSAGYTNTFGDSNVFIGTEAGYNNYGAMDNNFMGNHCGYSNTAGYQNVFSGNTCGYSNTVGNWNTFTGNRTGFHNTEGSTNSFYGKHAGFDNTTGNLNNFYGGHSGYNNLDGNENCAYGNQSLWANVHGVGNVVMGNEADHSGGAGVISGDSDQNANVFIGYTAVPSFITGDSNVFIGGLSDINTSGGIINNSGAFGFGAVTTANDKIILGNNLQNIGIGMSGLNAGRGPTNRLEISNYSALYAEPCVAPPPSSFNELPCFNQKNPTGASGLQFRDLTHASIPYPYDSSSAFLTVDDSGNVVLMYAPNGTGTGIGVCAKPSQFPSGISNDPAVDLLTHTHNFWFEGNGNGDTTTNVYIGYNCSDYPKVPFAKLNVLQASGSNNTIGEYVTNTDLTNGVSTKPQPLIGIESYIPPPTIWNYYNVAGWFEADPYVPEQLSPQQQYAIFVPGYTTPNGNNISDGTVDIGFPFATDVPSYYLKVNGTCWNYTGLWISDSSVKTNVNPITNALSVIDKLDGVSFNFKDSVLTDSGTYGTHYGFIAQQVARVLPNVVKKDNGKSAIAYTEIIPWTVEAIKQEKQTNDSLRYTLDSLRSAFQSIQNCLRTLCGDAPVHHNGGNGSSGDSNSAISNVQDVMLSGMANAPLLYQNIPNPFTTGTKINYFLPQGTVGATLVFYDTYGNQLKTVPLSQTGNGTLNITPDNLSSGIYSYSLIVNSNVVDTKRMILQK